MLAVEVTWQGVAFAWLLGTGAVAMVVTRPIERRLARRGWDVPRYRSDRGLASGIWCALAAPVMGRSGLFFALAGALMLLWYRWWFRRTPAEPAPITSARGERSVAAYLAALGEIVPVLMAPPPGSITDRIVLADIGRYERERDDGWVASLADGRTVPLILRSEGRVEFTPTHILRFAGSVGQDHVSLGDLHAALTAMSARGLVDPVREDWYTVQVRWLSGEEASRQPR